MLFFDESPQFGFLDVDEVVIVGTPPLPAPEGFEIPPGLTWDEWILGTPPVEGTEVSEVEIVGEGPADAGDITVTPPFGEGLDPSDLPGIIRALMCSQIDLALHKQANQNDAEIGGHVERTDDGYVISNLHWGDGDGTVDLVIQQFASAEEVPFYIHFHDDKPGVGSLAVSRGPSLEDLANSKINNIWQVVVDHKGSVYVINNFGDLVLPDGSTIPYADAVKARQDGLMTTYPKLESTANSWGSVNGTCQSG